MLSNRLCVGGNILALVNFTESFPFLFSESSPEDRSNRQPGDSNLDQRRHDEERTRMTNDGIAGGTNSISNHNNTLLEPL